MTLPALWDDIKHKSSTSREGTHDHDIHPEEDDVLGQVISHTHCSECDVPYKITCHSWGDGVICMPCINIKYDGEFDD